MLRRAFLKGCLGLFSMAALPRMPVPGAKKSALIPVTPEALLSEMECAEIYMKALRREFWGAMDYRLREAPQAQ